MQKRGQISIFMIIGIVLIFLVSFWFYIQNYSISRQGESELKENALLESDTSIFQDYFQNVFEESLYESLWAWGNSGGVDVSTTTYPTEEFNFEGSSRKVAYLYGGGVPLFNDELSLKDLRAIISATFLSQVDGELFNNKGYSLVTKETPEIINITNPTSTSFVFTPHTLFEKNENSRESQTIRATVDVGILELFLEINSFLTELKNGNLEPAEIGNQDDDISLYSIKSNAPLRICGYYEPTLSVSLIRVTYDVPFKNYDKYRFDFLIDEKIKEGSCTS